MKFAYFEGKIRPFEEAKVSIMTHAFNYGTGCFEGIRGYWNAGENQMFLLQMRDHYQRLINSCKVIKINPGLTLDEMCNITRELVRKNGYQEDVYIRPLAYKAEIMIGLGLTNLKDDFAIYLAPFGEYLDVTKGIRCCISTWVRTDDNAIPSRAKITGGYVNSSLAKAEAKENGYAEAIMLTSDGHVCEGTGENIFLVRNGNLVTPPVSDNILEGITRKSVIHIAKEELGIQTIERHVDRTELFVADEVFLCGTGAQITPVIEIDRRPISAGKIGIVTEKIQRLYFEAVRGENPRYADWIEPAYPVLSKRG